MALNLQKRNSRPRGAHRLPQAILLTPARITDILDVKSGWGGRDPNWDWSRGFVVWGNSEESMGLPRTSVERDPEGASGSGGRVHC